MKVAVIHSYYSNRQPSGENVVVDAQAAALREGGVDVRVIGAHTDELETQSGYKVRTAVNVSTGRGRSPIAELEAYRPDIVHVHNLFPNFGTRWLREWEGPVVATLHNFRPVCAAGTLFRAGAMCTLCPDTSSVQAVKNSCYRDSKLASLPLAIRNRRGIDGDALLQRADNVIALSERARALYVGFGLAPEKMRVIPNYVEDSGYSPEIPPGDGWVYIGRLAEEKGILALLRHWPESESLAIYGDGPLRSRVMEYEGANVKYMGQLGHDEIPRVLASAQGLVFPSEWPEGLPLIYAEALASGRPVVAKAGNSAADDVAEFGTGAVFKQWSELSEALSLVAKESKALGVQARLHYESAYTRRTWLDFTLNAYESVLSAAENTRA